MTRRADHPNNFMFDLNTINPWDNHWIVFVYEFGTSLHSLELTLF